MYKEKINLFISHNGKDRGYMEPFKEMIGPAYYVRDSSLDESEPNNANNEQYIKYRIIAPKIDWAGTVAVLIGPKTHERDYVNWEIEYAIKHDKRIIGVFLPGAEDSDVPEGIEKYGDALVEWDADKVISAIDGDTVWQQSDGNPRPSVSMPRGVC